MTDPTSGNPHLEDLTATRALALALMRKALELLDAAGEDMAAIYQQSAIDKLLRTPPARHSRKGNP